jgi:hypothetical protein
MLICLSVLFLTDCKKYPEGPLLSLRTRRQRIIGTWELESYISNGIDSTSYIKNNPLYSHYKFEKGGYNFGGFYYTATIGYYTSFSGNWILDNDKNQLRTGLYLHDNAFNMGYYVHPRVTWDIQRLKEKELWLKTNYNGKECFIKFKQHEN